MNTKDNPAKQIRQDAILRAVDRSLGNGLFQYQSIRHLVNGMYQQKISTRYNKWGIGIDIILHFRCYFFQNMGCSLVYTMV